MNKFYLYILTLLGCYLPQYCLAQIPKALDDTLRSNNRIYVVIAVLLVILTGIFLYLIRLDKKIDRLKKEN